MKNFLDFLYDCVDIDSMFVFDDINNCIDISEDFKDVIPLLFYFLIKIE